MSKTKAVIGALDKEERYSFKAVDKLIKCGYDVITINTAGKVILGIQSIKSINEISEKIDTLTIYVNPKVSTSLSDEILSLDFKRAIFNPGAENDSLAEKLEQKGVEVINGCTLVMLATNQY